MTLSIRRLNPVIGLEASGVQATRSLGDNVFGELYQAWLDSGGLLVLRDQDLEPEDQIAFSRRFGELDPLKGQTVEPYLLPGHPEIYRVSNKVQDGVKLGRQRAGTYWHSDNSHKERAAKASLLYGIEVPEYGGDTQFAGMARAWQELSPTMRGMLEGLRCVHDFEKAKSGSFKNEQVTESHLNATPPVSHPLVRTHPETGARCLFLNAGVVTRIDGMTVEESQPILDFLYKHCTRPEFVYRHQWRRGDLLIWDNRCAMHYAVADYDGVGDRYMHRTTVFGDRPV
jgi:taurine dioxygenase